MLSTHILSEVESVCDRVHIMCHGQLVFSDTMIRYETARVESGDIVFETDIGYRTDGKFIIR